MAIIAQIGHRPRIGLASPFQMGQLLQELRNGPRPRVPTPVIGRIRSRLRKTIISGAYRPLRMVSDAAVGEACELPPFWARCISTSPPTKNTRSTEMPMR